MAQTPAPAQPVDVAASEAAVAASNPDKGNIATAEEKAAPQAEESLELHGKQLVAAFTGMMVSKLLLFIYDTKMYTDLEHVSLFQLSLFLIALDQTILASALPKIVSAFNALDAVTWVSGTPVKMLQQDPSKLAKLIAFVM